MLRLVLRGLAVRKTRAALTALAVLLGVAMVSGSYVLTDTINRSFDKIFEETTAGVDVEVTPVEAIESDERDPPPFREEILDRVRRVDGVQTAVGGIFSIAAIIGKDGKPIQTQGAPNFVASVLPPEISPFKYVEGRSPASDRELALDKFTADRHDFKIGDSIGLAGRVPLRRYRVVGIARLGAVESFGGASAAVVTLREAQILTGNEGRLQSVEVVAADGVSAEELKRRIRAALPKSVAVRTGEEQAAKQSADSRETFSFLTTILLAFAFIAVFVGGFIIFNTFSITVAQRTKEFAMLRTLGASRRQILGSVFGEALAIGVVASALGLAAGIGYANAIGALFGAVGIDLPRSGTVLLARTIVVASLVGVVLTIVAALFPAIRATRVAPLEALREGSGSRKTNRRKRYALGIGLVLLGVGFMVYGVVAVEDSDAALSNIGLGTVIVFLGAAMLSPRLVPPLASLAGAPLVRLRGLTGRLARENTIRNPGRTAVTASALMIGLALVTFVTVFAEGLERGINDTIDANFRGDFVVQHADGFSPIPAAAGEAIERLEGVEVVAPWRGGDAKVRGARGNSGVTGLEPASAEKAFSLQWVEGSPETLANLQADEAVLDTKYADENGFEVGDTIRLTTPTADKVTLEVVGTVRDRADFLGDIVVSTRVLERAFDERQDMLAIVRLEDGAPVAPTRERIERLLEERFPTVEALNQRELKDRQAEQFNQLLGLIYALLSLAVIVSIFGIVNTLVLTIHERTRELGLLRAVGMSRRQVRTLVRYESVITALIGAILGAGLGVFFALVVSRPIADEGFVLTIPFGTILMFLVLAAVAGVLAAIPPARRASRLDVLEALAYE